MPRPIGHIRILVSARVLLDLEEADKVFKEKGEREYADYMRGRGKYAKDFVPELGGRRLEKGPAWDFAVTALERNKQGDKPRVEVGLLCKGTSELAVPIFRNLDVNGLDGVACRVIIKRELDISHLKAFGADLFLSDNMEDARLAVNNDIPAAVIIFPPPGTKYNSHKPGEALEVCFDMDSVLVDSESEMVFNEKGLEEYREIEDRDFDKEMGPGPFAPLAAKMSKINAEFPEDEEPFELSQLTARGRSASTRAITAAEKLGIVFNGDQWFVGGFSGGADKASVLEEIRPDIFLDDQLHHLERSQLYCLTGLVPYKKDSPMDLFLKEKEEMTKKTEPARRVPSQKRSPQPS